MEKKNLIIAGNTWQKVARIAEEAGLSPDKLSEALLEAFVEGKGKVFVGAWKEGPGIRLLPDWPRFSSGVIKIKKEDMK